LLSASPEFETVQSKIVTGEHKVVASSSDDATKILSELPPDEQKRLKVLRLEYDVLFSTGVRVPDTMIDDDWLTLLQKHVTLHSRKRYYMYLFKKEKAKQNEKRKRKQHAKEAEERRTRKQEELEAAGPDAIKFKNTFLLMIQESTMNRFWYNNVFRAMVNGPHIVFDFSYERHMTERELMNICTQMQLCHQLNKTNRQPFHFHFCNVPSGSLTESKLQVAFGNLPSCPITLTSQHYREIYPKEKLVYLSPSAPKVMDCVDDDDVYIIGAIVDKAVEDPLTLARAKEEKLRTVRFPIDKHIRWVQGSKSLPLNHVINILLEMKVTGDWKETFVKSLPKRKYAS